MSDSTGSAWERLAALPKPGLAELFAVDAGRLGKLAARLELPGGGILFDWSKTHLDDAHIAAFADLADAAGFAARREALFAGAVVNPTEGRAAEHTAQRGLGSAAAVEEAGLFHARMGMLVGAIHQGALGEVKHLIHIGIGGSALGPALAVDALARDGAMVDVHVVSNIDGCALEQAFAGCDPATTLIAVASKTFTTVETITNAESALAWLQTNGVGDPYGRVVALTAAPDKAVAWGVDETRVLPFAESVGGRYSLWSSIGFPVALALGWPDFAEMLDGAAAMDRHFQGSDGAANLPLRAAFADQYYARLRGCQTRATFAYDERLALLPDYL
jgi:glucose-6-phosphate isomerase